MLESHINVFMYLRYYVTTILKCTDDITFSSFTKISPNKIFLLQKPLCADWLKSLRTRKGLVHTIAPASVECIPRCSAQYEMI